METIAKIKERFEQNSPSTSETGVTKEGAACQKRSSAIVATDVNPVISVRNLRHSFGSGELRREVLNNVSVDLFPGEIVIVTGPSGAGKTTFLTLLSTLREIQSGSVTLDGVELFHSSDKTRMEVRKKIGFIFQMHNLLESLTSCQNVQMALACADRDMAASPRDKSIEMLVKVGLPEHVDKRPSKLSGGQKQRVAIARALVRKPKIIMADEPTASLDSKSGREIVDLLHDLAKSTGCTILMVTHDNRILDIADRIIKIEDGILEETRFNIDRIAEKMIEMVTKISLFFSIYLKNSQSSRQEIQSEFNFIHVKVEKELADLGSRNLNAELRGQVVLLGEILSQITIAMRETLFFVSILEGKDLSFASNFTEFIVQSLDFTLVNLADTAKGGTKEDVELIIRMTDKKGDVMNRLRKDFFDSNMSATEQQRNAIFDLTNAFVQIEQSLNQIARLVSRFDF